MALTDAIKRAPRWAWVTAGGIGLGAAGIKLWNNRGKPASETTVTAQEIGDPSSPYPVPQSTGNPVATIVPPVVIGSTGGGDPAFGLQGLHELYIGATQDLLQSYADVWGPVQSTQMMLTQGLAETLAALALAGSAPGGASMPAAIVPYPPPPAPAPTPLPAPAPPPPDPCTGEYPNQSARGCYKVGCASGQGTRRKGRWHFYHPAPSKGNGAEVWIRPDC